MFKSEVLLGKRFELPREYNWEQWVLELEENDSTPKCNEMIRRIRGMILATYPIGTPQGNWPR